MSNNQLADNLLSTYDSYMHLRVFVQDDQSESSSILKNLYSITVEKRNKKMMESPDYIDAGFDLMIPVEMQFGSNCVNKVDFGIVCAATMVTSSGKEFNTGYCVHPRSSLSKSALRLANSTGIIDAGYRGNLIGMFDAKVDCKVDKYERLLQICAPGLVPIVVTIVDKFSDLGGETVRGSGGFGSTGR
jgi:dUTP pyrophosphatase